MQINSNFFKNSINEINLLIKDLNQYIPFVEDLANKISELKDTQNNIYITINAFGDEMVDYLTEKEYRSAINSKIGGIVKMIKNDT